MRAMLACLVALSLTACALKDEAPAATAAEGAKQAQPLAQEAAHLSTARVSPAAPAAADPALDAPPPPPRPKPAKKRAALEKAKAQQARAERTRDAFDHGALADGRAKADDGKVADRLVVIDGLDDDEAPADLPEPAPEPEEVTEEEAREPPAPKTGLILAAPGSTPDSTLRLGNTFADQDKDRADRGEAASRDFEYSNRRGPAGGDGDLRGWAGLGLRPGDTLLAVNGRPVSGRPQRPRRGQAPVLEVERDGRRIVLYPDTQAADDAWADGPKPARFLPRVGYFENTYLGRSPEYLRQVRRLDQAFPGRAPYQAAVLPDQPLDAPEGSGLALTATLDRPSIEQPHRVFLQVALKGSERFGWRRPPLDLTLVVDAELAAREPETVTKAVTGLLRRLDPRDRLGVVVAQPAGPRVLSPVAELREARRALTRTFVDGLNFQATANPQILGAAMDRAGALLRDAAQGQARVPGSQTVLLLTRGGDRPRVAAAAGVAHQLTLQGAVTSVIDLADTGDLWWRVAQAGHGHDHRGRALGQALDAELASLAKVIARLLRINVRLAPDVKAVRILGSRMLSEVEKTRVKAREVATDRQISKTLGVKADRGDDDDGLQVVIPYFYGGDAHVVLIELWVDKPGPVAEVTLKYKDMVQLANATARASAELAALPAPLTATHRAVRANVRGFEFAQVLEQAAALARRGRLDAARRLLRAARPATYDDKVVVQRFTQAFNRHPQDRLADALKLASRRRIAEGGP